MQATYRRISLTLVLVATALLVLSVTATSTARAAQAASTPPAAADSNVDTEHKLEAARERLDTAAREVAELSAQLGENVGRRYMRWETTMPHAMLGVQIDARSGEGGAHVIAVSPGGAAAAAGIEANDVITAIDGEDLSKAANPARALVERMRTLKPDVAVKLRVAHAGKSREVDVTPRAVPAGVAVFAGQVPGAPGMPGMRPMPAIPPLPPMPGFAAHERLHERGFGPDGAEDRSWGGERRGFQGLELATLSTRLGGYFGARSGVLVVRAGGTSLKLEDGDVITALDGREATSAAHVTRILHSYQPGEKVVIKLIRDRKPQQIEVIMGRG